jgi:hypothetical protein
MEKKLNLNCPLEISLPVGVRSLRNGRGEAAGHPPAYSLRVLANLTNIFASKPVLSTVEGLAPTLNFERNGLSGLNPDCSLGSNPSQPPLVRGGAGIALPLTRGSWRGFWSDGLSGLNVSRVMTKYSSLRKRGARGDYVDSA